MPPYVVTTATVRHMISCRARAVAALFVAIVCMLGAALCACTPSTQGPSSSVMTQSEREAMASEKVLREEIRRQLDPLVAADASSLRSHFGEESQLFQGLQDTLGTDSFELLSHLLRLFSYEVSDVTVQGDSATAIVRVTHVDSSEALQDAAEALSTGDELAANGVLYESQDEEDYTKLVQHIYTTLYVRLDATKKTRTQDITLVFTKSKDEWHIDDSSLQTLVAALWE